MPEYLASGTDPDGRRVTDFVTASSADAAVAIYEWHGYGDVVLHWDDLTAVLTKISSTAKKRLSPRQILSLTRRSELGILLYMIAKTSIAVSLFVVALFAFSMPAVFRVPWSRLGEFLWPLAALPIAMIIAFAWRRHKRRLFRAYAWGRWEEVLRRLGPSEASPQGIEKTQLRAIALAGLGNIESALHEAERLQADERVPPWFYCLVVSQVYQAARDEPKRIEALKSARAEAPDNPTLMLALAMSLVLFKRDTAQAKELLAEAKKHAIADILQYQITIIKGMIALEGGNAKEAKQDLERARREAAPIRHNEMFVRVDGLISAYLCLADSQLADYVAARQHYQRGEPILRALHFYDLISRCRLAAEL
jgi:tetratricopeptide (TPR) repeat protein